MIHSRGFRPVAWVTRLQQHRWVNYKGTWQDDGHSSADCLRFDLKMVVAQKSTNDSKLGADLRSD